MLMTITHSTKAFWEKNKALTLIPFTLKKLFYGLNYWFLFLGFLGVLCLSTACNKRPNQIGADIQPNKGLISLQYNDTIELTAFSVIEDSVRTERTESALLGSLKDPVFGTALAGFYTQLRLSTSTHNFGTNPQLDSLVLQLAYSGYYGDTNTLQTIHVHELLDSLQFESAYYSNQLKATGDVDYANHSFMPKPRSRFVFGNDTLAAMIRVRLNDVSPELGNKLLAADSTSLSSNTQFLRYFKGLRVTAEAVTQGGAILFFNLPVTQSKMTLYYSNTEEDSLRYEFFITNSEARYNIYDHLNYADADPIFKNQVVNGDTLLGRNKFYLQAMGGLKARILFNGLNEIRQKAPGKIVVNEAKLIFTSMELDTIRYLAPSQLALVRRNKEGTYTVLSDQIIPNVGEGYFGGTYRPLSNSYQFRINRYVQELLSNDGIVSDDPGLFLLVQGAATRANRLILNGTHPQADSLTRLQLQLNYSVIND